MIPAWKPEFAAPKDIADAIDDRVCDGFLRRNAERCEPGGMDALALSPIRVSELLGWRIVTPTYTIKVQ